MWIDRSSENAGRVWKALESFGAPLEALDISRADLTRADMVIQLGLPPRRIDVLTGLTGVDFEAAWADRIVVDLGAVRAPVIGRATLVANKRATDRLQDRSDLKRLGELEED